MPAWIVPTARATTWGPLLVSGGCLLVISALFLGLSRWPLDLLWLGAAVLAAGLVAGLHDPAAALLAASPTSAARRRAHRISLLAPVTLAIWMVCLILGNQAVTGLGWPLAPVIALTTTGLAVSVWAPGRISIALGVATPLLWCLLSTALPGVLESWESWPDDVLYAWNNHPWIVTCLGAVALMARRDR